MVVVGRGGYRNNNTAFVTNCSFGEKDAYTAHKMENEGWENAECELGIKVLTLAVQTDRSVCVCRGVEGNGAGTLSHF